MRAADSGRGRGRATGGRGRLVINGPCEAEGGDWGQRVTCAPRSEHPDDWRPMAGGWFTGAGRSILLRHLPAGLQTLPRSPGLTTTHSTLEAFLY